MSHPSRPWARSTSPRRVRKFRVDPVSPLEERCVLTPYLPLTPDTATFTAATTPTNADLGTVTVTPGAAVLTSGTTPNTTFVTAAPVTSVGELTPTSSFGGDIVRLAAGPGGVFGNGLYAISRGAGGNTGAVNNPGVIYRIDPATGKASVFFDLNTVINQKELNGNASNSVGPSTGLVNWYDITFDPEGYFNGTPSMFVASADASDPNKNIIYQIGASGNLIGVFTQFTAGQSALKFDVNPTAILIPPVQDQTFLRGMFAGSGISSTATSGTAFSALYFDSNQYQPGQVLSNTTLPTGVSTTLMTNGPIVGMTASNIDYASAVYSAFTDFGTPAAGGIPARPGLSGVQGLGGEYLIQPPAGTTTTTTTTLPLDQQSVVSSLGRRFQDIAFDQYGYFSQGFTLTTNTTANAGGANGNLVDNLYSISQPINAGSVFVTDLASGLQVSVTPQAPLPTTAINVPVQSSGTIGVQSDGAGGAVPILQPLSTGGFNTTGNPGTPGVDSTGGRILRILPNGTVSVFAEGFNTSGAQDSTSFQQSSLSIAFSADGTTLYASDNNAIWQFKTVTDLASATSGSLIGLNDLRTFAVPYDGLGSAVAIVDTGVDANSTPFRGRVSQGYNVVTNGFGNNDLAPGTTTGTTTTTTTNNNTNGTTAGGTTININQDGHGTLVAGVVAQFVPQATLVPVDIFNPFQTTTGFTPTSGTTTGGTGGTGTTTTGTSVSNTSNAVTSSQNVWLGMKYVATHPFVADPVRPNTVDRVIASTFAFGTNETFSSEGVAYRRYPQVVNAFKFQLHKFLKLGIAPIAAAGELGEPYAAGVASATGTGGTTGGTGGTNTGKGGSSGSGGTNKSNGLFGNDNSDNSSVGDNNGMSLPAILNEVISVTGVIPFPFTATPSTPPTDPVQGVVPRPPGPILVYSGNTIGGTAGSTTTSSSTTNTTGNNLNLLTAGNYAIYSDMMLASSNRSNTTDFAAPAIDVPTFRRTFVLTGTTTGTSTTTTDPTDHLVFNQGGTSLASAQVTGAYAMVSSALNYWTQLAQSNGVTSDAYLTTPVGVNTLNFGAGSILNLNAYNNPNGINGILAWTAVPVQDANNGLTASTPSTLIGSNNYKSYARLSIGDAVAAIEGYEALNYLIAHNDLHYLQDGNGLVTAQSIQDFVDKSASIGLAEAGAMARLLGGTATTPTPNSTAAGENPDQPGALQRRFNFFDYAADGQLNGSITISQLEMLAHTLLPPPDAYTITNRAAASANGFLIDPSAQRNFKNLQHLLPRFEYAPLTLNRAYANSSPASYRVDRGVPPGVNFPIYALFSSSYIRPSNPTASTSTTSTGSSSTASTTSTTTTSSTNSTGSQTPQSTTSTTPSTTTPTTTSTTTSSTTSGTTSSNLTSNQIALQLINDAIQIAQQSKNAPNQPVPAGTIISTGTSTTGTSTTGSTTTGTSTTGTTTTASSSTGQSTSNATDLTTNLATATPVDSTTPTSTPTAVTSTSTGTTTTSSTTGSTSSTTKSNSTSGGTTS